MLLNFFHSWKFIQGKFGPFNPLSANFTKWSNTLKQFVGNLSTNCLSVFDHFEKIHKSNQLYRFDTISILLFIWKKRSEILLFGRSEGTRTLKPLGPGTCGTCALEALWRPFHHIMQLYYQTSSALSLNIWLH